MKKQKSTLRALLASTLVLIMCMSMLIGTTFAWFTDSVSSVNNIITSGNLDMKLSWKPYGAENTTWTEVDSDTAIFGKDALYEPGYTEAVWLKVENVGSLAFRYNLAIDIYEEKECTNKAGQKFKLSDYLTVKYMNTTSTDMESDFYTTRESLNSFAFGAASNSGEIKLSDEEITLISNGTAYSASDADSSSYVLVILQMPTTVGNEANHNGVDIPEIKFAVNAVATQVPHEEDSFGKDYDANAEYNDLPVAYVRNATEYENVDIKWGSYGPWSPTTGLDSQLEGAYVFTCKDTPAEAANSEYADWYCDFYVKLDKDLGENEIFLGGKYGTWGWIGFHNGNMTLEANTEIPLLGNVTSIPWTYEDVATSVGTFTCGVGDVDDALSGATFTVMLRLTNPEDATEYYNVAVVEHKFE